MKKKTLFSIVIFSVFLLSSQRAFSEVLPLNLQEWLQKQSNTIIVRPERNYPPFDFVDLTFGSKPKGLAVDYIELVARKVNASVRYMEAKPLSLVLDDLQKGKEGVVLAVTPTADRQEYLYFTEPFVEIPAVIVVRKDSQYRGGSVSLKDFEGKQVAVGDSYGVEDYIEINYPRVIVDAVIDDEVGLQKVLLGEVEAAVMDLGSLSYFTSKDILSYVVVAGTTGFNYELSFAVTKTQPELQLILNAGLKEITEPEKNIIRDRWITFSKNSTTESKKTIFGISPILLLLGVLFALLVLLLLIVIMVRLGRRHSVAVLGRLGTKKKKIEELKEELQTLETANVAVTENLLEIKDLEKQIANKIKEIE